MDTIGDQYTSAPYGLEIQESELIESRQIDLGGAARATVSFYAKPASDDVWPGLFVDFWIGDEWIEVYVVERLDGGGGWNLQTFDLPGPALRPEFKVRFRSPPSWWNTWYIDDVLVARLEADCDGDGVLDACQTAAGEGADCNHNGSLDECDFGQFRVGEPDDYLSSVITSGPNVGWWDIADY